jgi:ribosome-binding factor A
VVSKTRAVRIAERIHQELSELLIHEVQDARLNGISITGVKVDKELAYATVFVSSVEGESKAPEVMAGLEHAAGFFRSQLAARIELRVFPRLRFRWDSTIERAERIETLFASIRSEEKQDGLNKDRQE